MKNFMSYLGSLSSFLKNFYHMHEYFDNSNKIKCFILQVDLSLCSDNICKCLAGYSPRRNNSLCDPTILGDPCDSSENCYRTVSNSYCFRGTCQCGEDYIPLAGGTKCVLARWLRRDIAIIAIGAVIIFLLSVAIVMMLGWLIYKFGGFNAGKYTINKGWDASNAVTRPFRR